MTVHEFLSYCLRFYQQHADEQRIEKLAARFELELKRKIDHLSMGNRKKVSIVQSLLHSPKILILDEPTTGLDPLMQAKFFELIHAENQKGMTIFLSSHVLSEVQMLCKRVAIIKEGKIVQLENIETLRKMQLKKVYIESEDQVSRETMNISGIKDFTAGPGNLVTFMYSGDTNQLIGLLAQRKLLNLRIEEPTLEEIFMHYYK